LIIDLPPCRVFKYNCITFLDALADFRSEELRIKFSYPDGWTKEKTSGSVKVRAPVQYETDPYMEVAVVRPFTSDKSLDELLGNSIEHYATYNEYQPVEMSNAVGNPLSSTPSSELIGGKFETRKLLFHYKSDHGRMKTLHYIGKEGKQGVYLTFTAQDVYFDQYKPHFDYIRSTFDFIS
jgi:hypothetical protein